MSVIGNRPFDALLVGDMDRLVHTLTPEDFSLLATQAATMGAGLVDPAVAASRAFSVDAGQTGWASALMSALIAGRLPGSGSKLVRQIDRDDHPGPPRRRDDDRRQGHGQGRRRAARDDRGPRDQPARRPRHGRNRGSRRAETGDHGRTARRVRRGDAREGPPLPAAHRGHPLDEADPNRDRSSGRRGFALRRDRGGARRADRAGADRAGKEDPRRPRRRMASISPASRSCRPSTATRPPPERWRWRGRARSRR